MAYFIGHFNVEDLYYPGRKQMQTAGGACLYAAMGAAIWHRGVTVVSRIGSDYPEPFLNRLREMGVCMRLKRMPGPTMASKTEYLPDGSRRFTMKNPPQRLNELTPDVQDVQEAGIPNRAFVHVGAMNMDKLERIVGYLKEKDCFVSVDTCDSFVQKAPERLLRLVRKADLFLPSRAEVEAFPSGEQGFGRRFRWLAQQLPRTSLIVKDSTRGSYVLRAGAVYHVPACRNIQAVDATGAGDSFCGGLLAQLERSPGCLLEAAAAGTVSASYMIQQGGAFLKNGLCEQERDNRYREIKQGIRRIGKESLHGRTGGSDYQEGDWRDYGAGAAGGADV